MRRISLALILWMFAGSLAVSAQVLSPGEIGDDQHRALQEKYFEQLKQFGEEARAHKFPYAFYFSRVLDIEQPQQATVDQRSIRFDTFNRQVVLEITGNYYASYSSLLMDYNHRVRQDFNDVVLPLLKMAAPRLAKAQEFQAYAFEISHHVRHKVIGVESETVENVVFVFPRAAVERLVNATTAEQQQAAVLDSQILVDGERFSMWLTGDPPPGSERPRRIEKPQNKEIAALQPKLGAADPVEPTVSSRLLGYKEPAPRIVNDKTLGSLQVEHDATITRLVRDLDPQAHFVSYAPPSFIAFHNGAYLQLAVNTPLDAAVAGSSRYKLAALAFDEHIAHLVRPVLAYFAKDPDFDGIDFGTSVKLSTSASPLAVEFIFPLKALRCYANYDCTGQQLVNAGIVLMNGDRVTLELQAAEK
ncbi:MAG TPA: hypothetical protein VF840_01225 [Terriglobales bacterium]